MPDASASDAAAEVIDLSNQFDCGDEEAKVALRANPDAKQLLLTATTVSDNFRIPEGTGQHLSYINLSDTRIVESTTVEAILDACPRLTKLDLYNTELLVDDFRAKARTLGVQIGYDIPALSPDAIGETPIPLQWEWPAPPFGSGLPPAPFVGDIDEPRIYGPFSEAAYALLRRFEEEFDTM